MMKRLMVILIAAMLLTGCLGGNKEKDTSLAQENGSSVVQENESTAVQDNETSTVQENKSSDSKKTTAQPQQDANKGKASAEEKTGNEKESTAIVLENEGDIVITVPDDEEFGGE